MLHFYVLYHIQNAEEDWLNNFRMHGATAAVHRLVQFFVDLIQGDVSITLPPEINTMDGYNTFFNAVSDNLRDYIDFKDNPPLLRSFFAFIFHETNTVDAQLAQEWLTNTVDVLHFMSKSNSNTMQVFAGYCCIYVLEYLGVNSQAAFVALCSRLCSAIFNVYEICLSSTW